ncbi:MAG: response regulator transcription factor [Myxococcales bacterium]|nr:response regulator transcription factor [Myxococcales bacterium]
MRVLLVDDHSIVRDGLRVCMAASDRYEVVGEAEDGHQAVQLAQDLEPGIVIMDVAMPGMNGIEATRQIVANEPAPRIIILSMHSDREFVVEALRAGASGYLMKASAFEELLRAMDAVSAGKTYLSPSITDVVVDNYVRKRPDEPPNAFSVLTARERQILQLLAEGANAKEIAVTLGISDKTVHAFRNRVMEKLDLHSVAELTKYAIRHGITTLD